MLKDLYNNWKTKRELEARAKAEAEAKAKREARAKALEYFTELFTQSLNNVRYIKASMNTISGMMNSIKGRSVGDTKRRKEAMRAQLKWYENKLKEERAMVHYYAGRALISPDNYKDV